MTDGTIKDEMRGRDADCEMTTYDCLDCKKAWRQQLNETVAQCVYCQSHNTKRICTMSAVRVFTDRPDVVKR
jgi:DNA-directed RNA polymerase subunit RPC12/RpoP